MEKTRVFASKDGLVVDFNLGGPMVIIDARRMQMILPLSFRRANWKASCTYLFTVYSEQELAALIRKRFIM